ncbi:MAG: RBBP9/YdeN family alpha/beta hydrolase [Nocardioides sp.]
MLPSATRMPLVIVPGIYDSGPAHWQSYWEADHPDARRISPGSFDRPDLHDWVEAIADAIASCGTAPVLVAHSLGCLVVLEWAKGSERCGTRRRLSRARGRVDR